MNKSFVILGTNPSISFAELYQFLGSKNELIKKTHTQSVIIDNEELGKIAPTILGGIPKSGVIIHEIYDIDAKHLATILKENLVKEQKFHFGLSFYESFGVKISQPKLKALGLKIKKILKAGGASVRLVESNSGNLSSVDVVKNKLLDKGVELCIIPTKNSLFIGKTLAVQPFSEYSDRDFGRPGRDAKRGMIPPKLARAMVNMSKVDQGELILDPFCGVGTILQEALLLGYRAIGTDVDEQAIKDTKKNIEWLMEKYEKKFLDPKIDTLDVRKLDKTVTKKSVDAIVTEFDLGPPLQGDESETKILATEKSLSEFYTQALELMHYALKDNGRAVVAWPFFKKQNIAISVIDELNSIGWKIAKPYPNEYQDIFPLSTRGTLLYGREGQHVFREILILEKV